MENISKRQPISRAEERHQRKAIKRTAKQERIALKKAEEEKVHKMGKKPKIKDQKLKRPIQQARLVNH